MGKLLVLLQAALVPLYWSPLHQSPYVFSKYVLAVYLSLAFLLPLLLLHCSWSGNACRLWGAFDRPILALAGWMLVSACFSYRLGPALDLLLLYASAWVTWKAAVVFLPDTRCRMLGLLTLVVSGVISTLPVWKASAEGETFLIGTFGNPEFVAQFLILPFGCLLPWLIRYLIRLAMKEQKLTGWFILTAGAWVLTGITLLRLQSSAALLGSVLAIASVFMMFQMRGMLRLALKPLHGTLLIVFFLLLALGFGLRLFQRESGVQELTDALLADQSVRVRLELWKGSWNLIQDHLLTGVGPGNFHLVYPEYRLESEIAVFPGKLTTVEHAHNCYIEWVAELGLIGLALLIWFMHRITARIMSFLLESDETEWFLVMGILAAVIATDGQSFFSSNIYQISPVMGLGFLLGLLESTLCQRSEREMDSTASLKEKRAFFQRRLSPLFCLSAAALLFILVNLALSASLFRRSVSDILLHDAIAIRNRGQLDDASGKFDEAIRLAPHSYQAHYYRSLLALEQGQPQAALEHSENALRFQPSSFDALFVRGIALKDLERYPEAQETLHRVLRLFPFHEPARQVLEQINALT